MPALPRITHELIQRYNRPGPRYTSYPTVPVWQEGWFEPEYRVALAEEGQRSRPVALYLHLPFCRQLCTFCGCNRFVTNDATLVERYLSALMKEVEAVAQALGDRRQAAQVHWGGGTPTYLNVDQLSRVAQSIREHFDPMGGEEWAVEVHPRVTTREQLEALHQLGFRRLSFGVQDVDPQVQKAINRYQTLEQTWEAYQTARELGFSSINLDLVYGLPLQNRRRFRKTLLEVSRMRPDRLAIYSFAHLPWMFKAHERALREEDLPSPEEKVGIYLDTIQHFLDDGYEMIGMDHYALPDDDLARARDQHTLHRNFMGYTPLHGLAQIGLGVSAISDFGNSFWQNPKELPDYLEMMEAGKLEPRRGMLLDEEDRMRREVIEELMCQGELDLTRLEQAHRQHFGTALSKAAPRLRQLENEGLLVLGAERLSLTPLGRMFVRNVAMTFDRYLPESPSSSNPQFSQTV